MFADESESKQADSRGRLQSILIALTLRLIYDSLRSILQSDANCTTLVFKFPEYTKTTCRLFFILFLFEF